jgi:hypothetical protein
MKRELGSFTVPTRKRKGMTWSNAVEDNFLTSSLGSTGIKAGSCNSGGMTWVVRSANFVYTLRESLDPYSPSCGVGTPTGVQAGRDTNEN